MRLLCSRRSVGAPACLVRSGSPRLLRNWRGSQPVVTDWHCAPAFLAGCGTRSARHAAPPFRDGRREALARCPALPMRPSIHEQCRARPERPSGSELRGLRSREGGAVRDHRRRVPGPPSDAGGARAEPGAARASARPEPEVAGGRARGRKREQRGFRCASAQKTPRSHHSEVTFGGQDCRTCIARPRSRDPSGRTSECENQREDERDVGQMYCA
jgi:hypothetical protein